MSNNTHTLLLVEDDKTVGYLLSEYLKMNGFSVTWSPTAADALKKLQEGHFHLAILDVMLPDSDGFALAEKIKEQRPELSFLFLTARSLKVDVLKGFAAGAVDYLKKPIDEEELVVRIKTLLARIGAEGPKKINNDYAIGQYVLLPRKQELVFQEQSQSLTKRETAILALLAAHPNELCSYQQILTSIWGKNDYFNKKSLNVFISKLRKYLEEDPAVSIENVHNSGFILKVENG
ncbi:response regulator transcription factor [Altibacter sp. HG106]|uniref:response regulator transcription factor n=1 Tax=Altibacter sp. HG106 TaxID=3023937 RepID=UPI00234FF4D9|nr:response regulator transcription factor [Altibacter sp. HG106]MDC7995347.1 response regulator transcription factor [Altibacter sp. HG106]